MPYTDPIKRREMAAIYTATHRQRKRLANPLKSRRETWDIKFSTEKYKAKVLARLIAKRRIAESGCWEWTGSTMGSGYGALAAFGKYSYAHRVSWILHNGPIPDGMRVLHRCDNPGCFREDHLFIGTAKENSRDMVAKGRCSTTHQVGAPGEANGSAVLSVSDVQSIRRLLAAGISQSNIGRTFGVSQATVGNIARGKTWKSVLLRPNVA